MKVNIELDLGDVVGTNGPYDEDGRGEPLTLLDAIVAAAARQVVAKVDVEAADRIRRTIAAAVDEAIAARVAPLVADALAGDVQTEYGGQRVPLQQHIVDIVRKELKWADRGGSSYDRSLLAKLVHEQVERTLASELKADLDAAKAQVRAAVREKGAEFLAETAERLAR